MTLAELERAVQDRDRAWGCGRPSTGDGGWALAYPRQDAPGQPLAATGLPIPRPIIATIRRTRSTEFVQFTYCGKRISRERAKELLET